MQVHLHLMGHMAAVKSGVCKELPVRSKGMSLIMLSKNWYVPLMANKQVSLGKSTLEGNMASLQVVLVGFLPCR